MKRIVALVLVVVLVLSLGCMLVGCSSTKKGECEICGEKTTVKKIKVAGESGWVCDDCYKELKEWGLL